MVDKFEPLLIDDDPETDYEALPEVQAARTKRQAAIWDITRQLENITYSGTGNKQELVELEYNMRELIDEGTYGYKYIEGFLISMGYNLNKIRMVFKRLTGMDPQVYLDAQPCLDTPGTIPGMNYGWGASKDKKFDFYFVMPHKIGYSVFGQQGDLVREEIKYLASLDEARDFLKKKVSEVRIYDEAVSIKKMPPPNNQYLSENFPFGVKTAEYNRIEKYFDQIGNRMQLYEKKAILEESVSEGRLTSDEFRYLATQHGILRKAEPDIDRTNAEGNPDVENITLDDIMKEESKIDNAPMQEELNETTHMEFFEKNKDKRFGDDITGAVDYIMSVLNEIGESLSGFSLNFRSLKYISKEVLDTISSTPEVGSEKASEILSGSGTASAILDFTDKTLPADINMKQGLIVFSILGDDVIMDRVFKGVDNKSYSLDEDGLTKYFIVERTKNEENK